ncbi:sulfotransferase [uncultured Psychroserpens sp.]|uniref:sulfotransferase family protein n=1 Tax=uncultured Psychroserpens sp. TaxID=255436 RepID=UPI00260D7F39|nr:sulfotransferase [uncultured Psychroserpens sp.]
MINNNKVDFFCIGAQKSGTTSLHDILSQNPQIGLPLNKETHYFSHDELYTRNLKDYFKLFPKDLEDRKVVGEIDPEYLCSQNAPKRIFNDIGPDVKFIVIFRNPFDRAYSQYLMSKRRGFETLEFKEAILKEEERAKDTFGQLYLSYGSRSLYSTQIKRYLELYDMSNFLFLRFEDDFLDDKSNTIHRINSFLGLHDFEYEIAVNSNKASVPKSKMIRDFVDKPGLIRKFGKHLIPSSQLRKTIISKIDMINRKEIRYKVDNDMKREFIDNYFADDIKELQSITNLNLSRWLKET